MVSTNEAQLGDKSDGWRPPPSMASAITMLSRTLTSYPSHSIQQGNCLSGLTGGNSKEMKRTGTNRSNGANELQRTTSSFQGSVSDAVRYSDRPGGAQKPLTASDLHKSKTLEERLKKAGKVNDASRA